KLRYAQVSSCKFLSAINPIETPRISVVLTLKETEEGKLQLQAEGTVKDECFIKLKAVLILKA
ncbi:MAG TPA: 3-hydroxylacyl-ACP dehydratase, partial [Bacteroides reticulotermitis]|nr:3-hydroxylacyl-ACP dehydratase [Bacteroides reticulotermitis]